MALISRLGYLGQDDGGEEGEDRELYYAWDDLVWFVPKRMRRLLVSGPAVCECLSLLRCCSG